MMLATWERSYAWEHQLHQTLREQGWPEGVELPRGYVSGPLAALVAREPVGRNGEDPRWHISIQHKDRVPNWDELVDAAHRLRPGVVFAIGIPPRSWWINVHPHVLHLHELHDTALIEQWRFEGQGHTPT